jgi:hypothetical protein
MCASQAKQSTTKTQTEANKAKRSRANKQVDEVTNKQNKTPENETNARLRVHTITQKNGNKTENNT